MTVRLWLPPRPGPQAAFGFDAGHRFEGVEGVEGEIFGVVEIVEGRLVLE